MYEDGRMDQAARQVSGLLRIGVTAAPILFGIDKFFNWSVDQQSDGRDAETATPVMRAHLAGCPACLDEYESLTALAASSNGDESHA